MKSKGQKLAEDYGYETLTELCEDNMCESVIPAICMNKGCDATRGIEPDSRRGWCPECESNSVKSAFVILGII